MAKRKRRVKRKLKLDNIFLMLGLIILFVLVGIYVSKGNLIQKQILKGEKATAVVEKKNRAKKEEKDETEKVYKATMITAGDTLIHSSIFKDAYLANNEYEF